ncbi:28S ribosomal protein S9, mitochondrial [Lamellibrachia satsuma]|nr:28S ribosomal protein S9, mitochondrial [Lamellibrachia satsuma]
MHTARCALKSTALCSYSKLSTCRTHLCRSLAGLASSGTDGPSKGDTTPRHTSQVGNAGSEKAEKISKAMKAYLERAQSHMVDKFMTNEIAEYEIGKRHLANIMGEDPDTFRQEDIDKAIEYLLPSGLFDKKARPQMKHPSQVIPKRKAAEFGVDGRPFHFLFYTGLSNYYQLMHDINVKLEALKHHEDKMLARDVIPDPNTALHLAGSQWHDREKLGEMLGEKIPERDFTQFVKLMERIAAHPYSYMEKDFIMVYRRFLKSQAMLQDIPPVMYDEKGCAYMEAEGARKLARAKVKVVDNGTGQITVNGQSLLRGFPTILDREQIVFPLQFVGKMGEVDIEAEVWDGGPSGQAGAIRFALSKALQSFVDRQMVEKMRLAGLLTHDPRRLERQKPGQAGARKKFTWKKR